MILSALLVLSVVAVYGQTLSFGFVNYDDPFFITENPWVSGGVSLDGLRWAATTPHDGNWVPLAWLSLMLDAELYGTRASGFHLTNLLLHAANSVLLFAAFRSLTGRLWPSAVVAAVFALHPLHVESVAWVAERKDLLSTCFGLLAIIAYGAYARRPSLARYLPVAVCLALGLMAKPMLVTLPCLFLLLDLWPLGRFGGSAPLSRIGRLVAEKVPLFAMVAASSIVTVWAQSASGAFRSFGSVPLPARLANAVTAYAAYIGKSIWPHRLAVFYPHPGTDISVGKTAAAAALLMAVTVTVVLALRKRPYAAVGWFWYLGTLVPVIGLVQVGSQAMADRYMYIPLIGLTVMVAWAAADLLASRPRYRFPVAAAAIVVLAALGVRAHQQTGFWQSSQVLFTHALSVTERNANAHINLGAALASDGRHREAAGHFRQALEINPGHPIAHFNLGGSLAAIGRSETAIAHFRESLRLNPSNATVHVSLANVLAARGRFEAAYGHYQEAIRLAPDRSEIHSNLGNLLASMGRFDEAVAQYEMALAIEPANGIARGNFGIVLARLGRANEALVHLAETIRLRPDHAGAYYEIGEILNAQGRPARAREFYRQAARLEPDRYTESGERIHDTVLIEDGYAP